MKKLLFLFLFSSLLLVSNNELQAQRERPEPPKFSDNLWYGGGIILGFQLGTFENVFNFGLSPMIGYRLFDEFSLGLRTSVLYTIYTIKFQGDNETIRPLSWEVGVFARYRFPRSPIFAHAELGVENQAFPIFVNNELIATRVEVGNTYLGAGYTSGDRVKYEILALYNLNQNQPFNQNPIEFRFGFTVGF